MAPYCGNQLMMYLRGYKNLYLVLATWFCLVSSITAISSRPSLSHLAPSYQIITHPAKMRFSSLVLGLAATASAIDIRGHDQDVCRGGYVACVNVDPNVCCTFGGKASIWVAAIPSAWRIRAQSSTGGGCTYLATEGDNNGTQDICLAYTSRGLRTGARYWFLNRKRAEDETCPAAQPDGGKCEASVKPNVLGLADGTEYNIEGLSDEKVAEMEKIMATGAGADAMPAEFHILRRSIQV
ncbi:hypothetical protein PspLS_04319 [Pyricularia sp. CBS 133598]|nr:hypothetical protein PspLS_04319 [Pyricularia sp. CBS 133598]